MSGVNICARRGLKPQTNAFKSYLIQLNFTYTNMHCGIAFLPLSGTATVVISAKPSSKVQNFPSPSQRRTGSMDVPRGVEEEAKGLKIKKSHTYASFPKHNYYMQTSTDLKKELLKEKWNIINWKKALSTLLVTSLHYAQIVGKQEKPNLSLWHSTSTELSSWISLNCACFPLSEDA